MLKSISKSSKSWLIKLSLISVNPSPSEVTLLPVGCTLNCTSNRNYPVSFVILTYLKGKFFSLISCWMTNFRNFDFSLKYLWKKTRQFLVTLSPWYNQYWYNPSFIISFITGANQSFMLYFHSNLLISRKGHMWYT